MDIVMEIFGPLEQNISTAVQNLDFHIEMCFIIYREVYVRKRETVVTSQKFLQILSLEVVKGKTMTALLFGNV